MSFNLNRQRPPRSSIPSLRFSILRLRQTLGPAISTATARRTSSAGCCKAANGGRGKSTGSAFSNSLWATWSTAVSWVDVQVADLNGDGKADISGRVSQEGSWWTGLSTGSSFNSVLGIA
jgi:hypothetical protein